MLGPIHQEETYSIGPLEHKLQSARRECQYDILRVLKEISIRMQ